MRSGLACWWRRTTTSGGVRRGSAWRKPFFGGAVVGALVVAALAVLLAAPLLMADQDSSSGGTTFSPSSGEAGGSAVSAAMFLGGASVVINEYSVNVADGSGWVELFNRDAAVALDVTGFALRPHQNSGSQVLLTPANTAVSAPGSPVGAVAIPAQGFAVVTIPAGFFVADLAGDVPAATSSAVARRSQALRATPKRAEGSQRYGSLFFVDPAEQGVVDSAVFPATAAAGSSFFRFPDGGFWAQAATAEPTKLLPNVERAGGDGVWTPGQFEIHVFDAGQGDAQLIIFPSGYSILVDTCEMNWNSGAGAAAVAAKLDRVLSGKKRIDAVVLSHLHLDHIGYVGYGGIWALIEKHGYSFGQIVDRDGGVWVDANGDGECDHTSEIKFKYAGTTSGTGTRWLCYATDPSNADVYNARQTADICSTTQISPPDADGFVQIIAADGKGGQTHEGDPLAADYTKKERPPSENGYSLGLLVRFGDIEYVTAGDLDGADASSTFGYTYNDVESVVAKRLTPKQTDIYRADHHGSAHSSNVPFVAAMEPTVSLISCGVANSYGHPSQTTLDRLLDSGDVHITNICNSERDFQHAIMGGGDLVVKSSDGKAYSVSSLAGSVSYSAKAKTGSFGANCQENP